MCPVDGESGRIRYMELCLAAFVPEYLSGLSRHTCTSKCKDMQLDIGRLTDIYLGSAVFCSFCGTALKLARNMQQVRNDSLQSANSRDLNKMDISVLMRP